MLDGEIAKKRTIITEGNLEELPLGLLNAGGTKTRTLEFQWKDEYEGEGGEIKSVVRRWVVEGSERYGLPGEKEQDVYVAILALISQRGGIPEDRVIGFSLYELLEIMGDGKSGAAYRQLRKSLRTISRSTIESYRAFYNRNTNKYISDEFQIFTLRWSELEDLEGRRLYDHHELLLHPYFVQSYYDDYAGRLDPRFYWNLRRATSKRLYRLLDRHAAEKRQGGQRTWEVSLDELCGLMPLSVSRPAMVMGTLNKAHEELKDRGFLKRWEYTEVGKGRWKRVFVKYWLNKKFSSRTFSKRIDLTTSQEAAVEQMRYWGMSRAVATEWVLLKGAEHCEKWSLLLHFQPNVDRRKAGGLLNGALENEYDWWEENARKALSSGDISLVSQDALDKTRKIVDDVPEEPDSDRNSGGVQQGFEWFFGSEDGDTSGKVASSRVKSTEEQEIEEHSNSKARAWFELLDKLGAAAQDERFSDVQPHTVVGSHLMLACEDSAVCSGLIEDYGERLGDLWREHAGDQEAKINIGTSSECDRVFEHLYGSVKDVEFVRSRAEEDGQAR